MTTKIHQACAQYGSCTISEASMQPRDVLPKLLEALKELAPAAHQQVTMPGAGFALVPSDALDDGTHDFWSSEAAADAMLAMMDALEENAPEGFTFGTHEGDGACYGFWPVDADDADDEVIGYTRDGSFTCVAHTANPEGCEPVLAGAECIAEHQCGECPTVMIDAPSQAVLDSMFSWHGGMGSKLYAAASMWQAGHEVTLTAALEACDELDFQSGKPNFTEADAEAVDELKAHIQERR